MSTAQHNSLQTKFDRLSNRPLQYEVEADERAGAICVVEATAASLGRRTVRYHDYETEDLAIHLRVTDQKIVTEFSLQAGEEACFERKRQISVLAISLIRQFDKASVAIGQQGRLLECNTGCPTAISFPANVFCNVLTLLFQSSNVLVERTPFNSDSAADSSSRTTRERCSVLTLEPTWN